MENRIRRNSWFRLGGTLVAVAVGTYVIYDFGVSRGREMASSKPAMSSANPDAPLKAGDIDPATGKRVLYWHDPMVPGQRFDQPGQSPFMNMKLVPVYEGGGDDSGSVTVSSRVQQNLGIRTAEVERRTFARTIDAVGNVALNERDQVIVQTRATAFVEGLHVRAVLDRVSKGQALADLYVPEWVAAQEEFLSLRRMDRADLADLIDASRHRLRQVGMTDEQIESLERRGAAEPRITVTAPIDGVVVELAAREGMTATAGETLFRINGLSTAWVNVAIPESQAALLRPGAAAQARSLALPGSEFRGTVQAILPEVDLTTRTIRARVELANVDRALAPGMFVSVTLATEPVEAIVVPTEAVIRTGRRAVVVVNDDGGTFRSVDVELGFEDGGDTEIRRGLEAGQRVVVSGQFLLDSEASLRAAATRMQDPVNGNAAPQEHRGEGDITAISNGTVTVAHGPIPTIQWGSMTMEFVLPSGPRADLQVDEHVSFSFTMGDDGKPRLTRIEPAEGAR